MESLRYGQVDGLVERYWDECGSLWAGLRDGYLLGDRALEWGWLLSRGIFPS
ncbi:hypothetical protein [Candidatus Methylacidithermus pantelleriae]|uniref:Uncharacterized protein n=1 Tax=Candidatus Methylacidithermus pantelleriae TaxID=2744239 RepID=A0A8J2BS47_9BACT|nr:hypothetical protein [Candidatus Methylacidithermus pantelleriae]CAF0694291.1 hypothetical protein MPNT_160004 [Candidatus Methylacidithermus pantelleriae]